MRGERDELDEGELAELVDYLAGALAPAAREAVRHRLEMDPEYAARAHPVVASWVLTAREEMAAARGSRAESETREAWNEVRRRIVAIEGAATIHEVPEHSPAVEGPARGGRRRLAVALQWRRRVYRGLVVPVALSFLALVVGVYGHGMYLVLGPGWVQGHLWRGVHRRLNRPVVDVVTNHATAQVVRLPDGSTAVLDLMTWLSYPEHMGDVARNVGLLGQARFTVAPGGAFPFELVAGPAVLRGGTEYTVDHIDPSKPVTVWVTRGVLTVRLTKDEDQVPIPVSAGHVVRVTQEMIQVDTAIAPPPAI